MTTPIAPNTRYFTKLSTIYIIVVYLLINISITHADTSKNEANQYHQSTSVNYKIPKSWAMDKGGSIEHSDALFGVPFHKNREILGKVFYMTPGYDGTDMNSEKNGCASYPVTLSADTIEKTQSKIYLVDRGGCTFTDKATIAQMKGAQAVIVANNQCVQSDVKRLKEAKVPIDDIKKLCCAEITDNCLDSVFEFLPFMISNGAASALSIQIPAIMLSLTESMRLKYCLCKERPELNGVDGCKDMPNTLNVKDCQKDVMLQIKVDIPHIDGEVHYEVWMKPDDQPTFFDTFEWFSESLHSVAKFQPQYIVHEPIECVDSNKEDSLCKDYCVNVEGDRHVCYLPDTDNFDISGKQVLYEIVRQTCVWNQEKDKYDKKGAPMWWMYQKKYRELNCMKSDDLGKCSKDIVKNYLPDIDQSKWESCSKEGSSSAKDILKYFDEQQQEKGIFTNAMMINSRIEHFSLSADTLAARICDGYPDDDQPNVCQCVHEAATEEEFLTCEKCIDKHNCSVMRSTGGGVSKFTVVMVMLFSMLLAAGAFAYTRNVQKGIRSDMRSMLAEYMPLDEFGSESNIDRSAFFSSNDREDSHLI